MTGSNQGHIHRAPLDRDIDLSVITSCLNERENIDPLIRRTLAALEHIGVSAEFVIVDDGSTDGTWAAVEDWLNRDARIQFVRHDRNRGIEQAWKTGLSKSRGRRICFIDADLQNQPEDIAKLFAASCQSPDAVIQGTRRPVTYAMLRYVLSRGLNSLLNVVFDMNLNDNKSGFIVGPRQALRDALQHRYDYRYYQCFLVIALHKRGWPIRQIDTVFHPRSAGKSFLKNMPVRVIFTILWEMIKARTEFRHYTGRQVTNNMPSPDPQSQPLCRQTS